MPATFDEFVRALCDCGLMTQDELRAFFNSFPPEKRPKTLAELAGELFRQKKLTKYQCQAIYHRRIWALAMGNYVIEERLGTGGMGQVFKARHRKMERTVAIKVLPPELTQSPHAVQRFHREVKAAARLSHPNIVTAYDADEARGVHFLVMEHVDGGNLSLLVKQNGPLPVGQALACTYQAARGLQYAHGEGVIHRDIKPSNLLLDKRGTVKILDMGLARIEEAADADGVPVEELTQSGYVMGSVDYMSPEQGFDLRTTDERSDVYSLGATMHFLLIGRPMYRANTVVKRILAHRDFPVPSLRAARPEVPEAVDAVFQRMVAKRPEDRPRSMTEVMTQLEGCLARLGQKLDTSALRDPFGLGRAKTEDTLPPSPVASLLDEWLLEEPTPSMGPVMMPFSFGFRRKTRRRILIGLALVGLALGSWIGSTLLVKATSSRGLQISEGIVVVEPSEPDVKVQVFDENDKLEIALTAETSPVSILVKPGRHRLSVEKEGFQPFRRPFTAGSGTRLTIPAKLQRVPPQ